MSSRTCGSCTLCCKLLPMKVGSKTHGIHKPAGERCPHQRMGKGCAIYDQRPWSCRLWNCRWLVNDDTADLRRPDRSRYVIDISPDFIVFEHNETGERTNIQVVQIWCDPQEREAWNDPPLLAYLDRRGKEGIAALVRYSETDAITIFPPSMSEDGEWHIVNSGTFRSEHTAEEKLQALASARRVIVGKDGARERS